MGIKDNETNITLLSDTYKTPLLDNENPVILHSFNLAPTQAGFGRVDLDLSYGTTADRFDVTIPDEAQQEKWMSTAGYFITSTKIKKTTVASGSYDVCITFYKDDFPVYTALQTIVVLDGMTTNRWVYGGGDSPVNASGEFVLTSSLLKKESRECFYVGSTPMGEAAEHGDGSSSNPVTKLSSVFKIIEKVGTDSPKNYQIFINGKIEDTCVIPASFTSSTANSITITGMTGSAVDILDGNNIDTVLNIKSPVPVTLSNIQITNGKATAAGSSNCGGGIYNAGELRLNDGVKSVDNHEVSAEEGHGGGGIFNQHYAYISGGVIAGNTALHDGAGIYTQKNYLFIWGNTLIGGTGADDGNKASGNGGGIYVKSGARIYAGYRKSEPVRDENVCRIIGNSADNGGGIYTDGYSYLHNVKLAENAALTKGGAVYMTYDYSHFGGAVYMPWGVGGIKEKGKNDALIKGKIRLTSTLRPPAECTDGVIMQVEPYSYSSRTILEKGWSYIS